MLPPLFGVNYSFALATTISPGQHVRCSNCRCAGISRRGVEDEKALRERNSKPLGPEFCAEHREVPAKRKQGHGRAGYRASKKSNRDADAVDKVEGNTTGNANASSLSVLRSRRPHARPETPCTRTGRPRRCLK